MRIGPITATGWDVEPDREGNIIQWYYVDYMRQGYVVRREHTYDAYVARMETRHLAQREAKLHVEAVLALEN